MRRGEYMRRGLGTMLPHAHIRADKKSDASAGAHRQAFRRCSLSIAVANTVHCSQIMPMLFDFFC